MPFLYVYFCKEQNREGLGDVELVGRLGWL